MTVKEMREARAAKIDEAGKLATLAKTEKRELTEDENGKIDALLSDSDALAAQIERTERLETAAADIGKSRGRKTEADTVEEVAVGVSAGKDRREDDPTCGFKTYGEFCGVVHSHSVPGFHGAVDDRISFMAAAYGQNEAAGEDGGFLVPPEYSNRIVERAFSDSEILGKCDRLTLRGNSIELNGTVDHDRSGTTYRHGGVIVYWVAEAEQFTRSTLKFRKITLKLNKLGALSFCTDEELSDAIVNFGERLFTKHAEAISEELTEAVMFGNGTGKPLGAFNTDACVSVTRGTATSFLYADVMNMEVALWNQSDAKALWLYNPEVWPQIRQMKLASGTGNEPATIVDVRGKTIDGRPYIKTEHCEALGTAGDVCLGDFSQYLLATKGSIQTAMSIHLRFDYQETAFRSSFRVDGKPAWDRALTPRKGTQTVSPFVKLS